jgi:hypothetical protein
MGFELDSQLNQYYLKQKNMKKIFTIALLLVFTFCLISMKSKENDFRVFIEQNGKIIEPNNGVVTLEKKSFNIVFEFSEPMGLLINGSFKSKTNTLASKGKPMSKLPGFHTTGLAEGLLNPDKEMFVSKESPNYWFYDDPENNRFNSTEKVNGKILCKRVIENFNDLDSKAIIKIGNVVKPLYLVFISYKYGETMSNQIELKRDWLQINWIQ